MRDLWAAMEGVSVSSVALLSLGGVETALQAVARFGAQISLIDLKRNGNFGGSDWVVAAQAALAEVGVTPKIVSRAQDLRPVDLVLNLAGFGDQWKAKPLSRVLGALLHSESRMVSDIRFGSGSYGVLKAFGETSTLAQISQEPKITRVILIPNPPETSAETDPAWAAIARDLAGRAGFFRDNGTHSFLYIQRGKTLVVTFDNLDIAMNKRAERRPWGFEFIQAQGWSMLGVMAGGWTWYRDPWVSAEFDRLRDAGFFAQFERVVFYGASMGGYAACAFSGACAGADVVAISPQSTVDRRIVPWESRYKTVWGADFSGPYGDAAQVSGAARRITLLYDPFEPLDRQHAERFAGENVVKLRASLMGHRLGSSLSQMGILTPIILGALNGTLSEAEFYQRLRARREFPRYQRELFARAVKAGHLGLARRLGAWVLARGDGRWMRAELAKL